MLDLPRHHYFRDVFTLQYVYEFPELADVDPVQRRRNCSQFGRGLILYRDYHHVMTLALCRFERKHRKPAVAGNHSIAPGRAVFHFTKPRDDPRMKSSSSAISPVWGISSSMRASACDVFKPARVSNRNAFCKGSIASASYP